MVKVADAVKVASFKALVRALNEAQVSFLVVEGLAVVAHGFGRSTRDVDLVARLDRAYHALFCGSGTPCYEPRVPTAAEQFAEVGLRKSWIREKGMLVRPAEEPPERLK